MRCNVLPGSAKDGTALAQLDSIAQQAAARIHLATALGVITAVLGHRLYFTTAMELASKLGAFAQNRQHRLETLRPLRRVGGQAPFEQIGQWPRQEVPLFPQQFGRLEHRVAAGPGEGISVGIRSWQDAWQLAQLLGRGVVPGAGVTALLP